MPPRKRTADDLPARLPTVAPVGVTTPMQAPALTQTEERRERELEDLLQELGSDGRIRVWHVVEGKPAFAGEMALDGFSLEALLETYGGGDKSLVFYQGRTKVDTLRVSLDPSIPPRNPRAARAAAAAIPGAPSSGLGDLTALIAAMAQGNMSTMQMMQTMTAQNAQAMNTMLSAVATALAAKKDDRDPMDMAVKMAELLKPNASGSTPASELFSIFEKGMNVAKNLGGNDEDGTIALAREGLGVVAKIVENNKPATTPIRVVAPRQAATSVPAHTPTAPAAPVTSSEPTPEPTTMTTVRPWVAAAQPKAGLLLLSIGNVRAETAADMIADNLTDEQFADLLDDIDSGTPQEFVSRFAQYFGFVLDEPSSTWLLACVEALRALVEPEDLPESSDGATSGA